MLEATNRNDSEGGEAAPGDYLDWKESSTHLARAEAWTAGPANLTGGDEPERIEIAESTPRALRAPRSLAGPRARLSSRRGRRDRAWRC